MAAKYGSSGNGKAPNVASRGRPSLEAMASRDLWPTPTEGDSRSSGSRNLPGSKAHAGVSLTDAVTTGDSTTSRRWPTPTTQDASNDGGPSQYDRKSVPLNAAVKLWPTPKASPSGPAYARAGREESGGDDLATAVARDLLPTPTTGDAKSTRNKTALPTWDRTGAHAGTTLTDAVVPPDGQLNPGFVEWMMGVPRGWTDLEVECGHDLDPNQWPDEWPDVPRVAKGIEQRNARLAGLGNAALPQVVAVVVREMIRQDR